MTATDLAALLSDAIADALAFPDWAGGNVDARADGLGDLSWLPAPGWMLLIDHAGNWQDAAPAATLIDVVDAAAGDWATRGVPLWTLLPQPRAAC